MSNSRTHNVMRNTAAGMVVKVMTLILNFALKTVFIKSLGIQYSGISSLFTDILILLSFAELGIGSAITFALYKPVANNDTIKVAQLMGFYKNAYRFVGIFVFIGGCILIPFLKNIVTDVPDIKEDIRIIYFLYILNTSASYFLIYKSSILDAKQKKYLISAIQAVVCIFKIILEVTVLLIFKDFIAYLIIDITITILQNLIISYCASKEYDSKAEKTAGELPETEKKKIYTDIAALSVYKVSGVLAKGTDSVIISAFLGTSTVGILSYYKLIISSVLSFISQFFTASSSSVGNLAAESDGETQYRLFIALDFAVFWAVCFCSTCLFVLLSPFVNLWLGNELVLHGNIVFALVLDFFFTCMIETVGLFRNANGLFVQGKYRPAIMVLINIGLSILLMNYIGLFGVLIATAISRFITQVWFDPWVVYKYVFKRSVLNYYKRYLFYIVTTIISIMLVLSISQFFYRIGVGIMTDFVFRLAMCILVPNTLVVILWHKSQAFSDCMARIKSFLGKL